MDDTEKGMNIFNRDVTQAYVHELKFKINTYISEPKELIITDEVVLMMGHKKKSQRTGQGVSLENRV